MSDKPTAVRVYLARVRTALADLPASEIEEILEDVRPHLAELEAELGEGARWDADRGELLWVDIVAGVLRRAVEDGGTLRTVAELSVGAPLGAVAPWSES